jgi:hypothetical protein
MAAAVVLARDVISFARMLKKASVMIVGVVVAAMLSFVGAGGCDEAQNAFNCTDLCNRYRDCFDHSYDTGSCSSRCQDNANSNQNFDERANSCQNCMNDNSCAAATFSCPSCAGIVP